MKRVVKGRVPSKKLKISVWVTKNMYIFFVKLYSPSCASFFMSAEHSHMINFRRVYVWRHKGNAHCKLASYSIWTEAGTEAWSSSAWQPGVPTCTVTGLASSFFWKTTLDGCSGSSKSRAEWKGPSEHSVLCSVHFTDEPDTAIASSLGLDKPWRRLKVDAVPTVFKRAA